jgi:ketosteroid isomerase-like protein
VACPSSHPTSFRSTSFRPCDKAGLTTNWQEAFAVFTGPFDYEVHDLNVTAHGELAVVHSLNHVNATLASGHITDLWLRWTACLRESMATGWLCTTTCPSQRTSSTARLL